MIKFDKFYITTALDYTNAPPHLGHAWERILSDVLARWHRSKGETVFFLTGTDEHGINVERAAKKAGKTPKEFVDEIAKDFKRLVKVLNVSNDDFIRTTEQRHIEISKKIFKKVFDKGDIYKGVYEGLYCTSCEAFYLEKDLIDEKCPIHKKKVEPVKEETYFFKLSKYQNKIIRHIEENENFILPESKKREVLNRLKEDLRDLSVSRTSIKWGIPLPNDKNHRMYVWFEALTNYVTALEYPGEKFKTFWPADIHVIGKDILWFHTVIWPGILLAIDIELPKTIFVHGFINIGGEKLSKTRGLIVDPFYLVKKYGVDALRFFLIKEIPTDEDGNFSEEALIEKYNGELADSLGNLVSRTFGIVKKYNKGIIPKPGKLSKNDEKLKELFEKSLKEANEHIKNFKLHKALQTIWSFVIFVNKYIHDSAPWELAKKDKERLNTVLYNICESLRVISALLYPFIPETCEKIVDQLDLKSVPKIKGLDWGALTPGKELKKSEILFPKIDE